MAIEFENAPKCCKEAMESIRKLLETGDYLAEFLAIAPSLSLLGPRVSVLGALWRLGSGVRVYARVRPHTQGTVDVIVRNRILTIIDGKILQHNGNPELRLHWTRMRQAF